MKQCSIIYELANGRRYCGGVYPSKKIAQSVVKHLMSLGDLKLKTISASYDYCCEGYKIPGRVYNGKMYHPRSNH